MARNYSPYISDFRAALTQPSASRVQDGVRGTYDETLGMPVMQSIAPEVAQPTITQPESFGRANSLLYNDPDFTVVPQATNANNLLDISIPTPELPTDFSARIGELNRTAGLAGLSGMLMGLAAPTRRGESRLMKSMALGQKMGAAAQAEAKDILAQEIAVDKYQRERDKALRQRAIMDQVFGQGDEAGTMNTSYKDSFDYKKLPTEQRQYYDRAMQYKALGDAYTRAGDSELAKSAYEQATALQSQAYEGFLNPSERVKAQADQRKTWKATELVPRQSVVDTYNKMVTLSQQAGGLKDYALLINFVKSLDPTSVVREGEVSMAASFQALQSQLQNLLQKARTGEFTEPLRRQMVSIAREMAEIATEDYNLAVEKNTPLIQRDRLDPQQIVVEIQPMRPMPPSFATDEATNSVLTELDKE